MGRLKGSKNKPKAAPPKVKAKAKRKAPARVSKPDTPPDWLRKAMAVKTPTRAKAGRKPNVIKEKFKAKAKARRGKTMTISKDKPLADPLDDPDLRAGAKGDVPIVDPKPPGVLDPKPGTKPVKPRRGTREGERDEIDDDKVRNVIADTLGGSGDQHARAQQILDRFDEAGWIISAGEGEPSEAIQTIFDSTEAEQEAAEEKEKAARQEEARQAEQGDDPKGADAGKGRSKDDPKGADDGKSSRA